MCDFIPAFYKNSVDKISFCLEQVEIYRANRTNFLQDPRVKVGASVYERRVNTRESVVSRTHDISHQPTPVSQIYPLKWHRIDPSKKVVDVNLVLQLVKSMPPQRDIRKVFLGAEFYIALPVGIQHGNQRSQEDWPSGEFRPADCILEIRKFPDPPYKIGVKLIRKLGFAVRLTHGQNHRWPKGTVR